MMIAMRLSKGGAGGGRETSISFGVASGYIILVPRSLAASKQPVTVHVLRMNTSLGKAKTKANKAIPILTLVAGESPN